MNLTKKQIFAIGLAVVVLLRMMSEMSPKAFLLVMAPIGAISWFIAWRKGVFAKDSLEFDDE